MTTPNIKLKKVSLLNFRGAKDLLDLDLSNECKSCAIFGYNGEGKSAITQALEWFFVDKIALLRGEGISDEDIVNLAALDTDETNVNIVFNKGELNSSKTYDKARNKSRYSNTSSQFTTYLENEARYDRLYLDQHTILWFLLQSKGQKKEEIAKIVGYEEIIKVKATISATLRNIERHTQLMDAQRKLSQNQGLMTREIYGEAINDIETLFIKSEEMLKIFGIDEKIKNESELDTALQKAFHALPSQKRAQEKIELENMQKRILALDKEKDVSKLLEDWTSKFNALVSDKQNVSNLNLDEFLRQAEKILSTATELKECPLCEQGIEDGDVLLKRVIERYRKLVAIRGRIDTSHRELSVVSSEIQQIEREIQDVVGSLDFKKIAYDKDCIKGYNQNIKDIRAKIKSQYKALEVIELEMDKLKASSEKFGKELGNINTRLVANIQNLTITKEEEIKHVTYQKLLRGKNIVLENIKLQKQIEAFKYVIKNLRQIEAQMLDIQNKTMIQILDLLSQDVNRFFCYLNKKEKIKNVKLALIGEEGIEFSLEFYDNIASPPKKYLSESQFNSLGIAFFLAAVKKFNKANRFFVLDDVLVSFDRYYRIRLLDLLAEEFNDYQILLLTHEEYWYQMIRKKFPSWIFKEVSWCFENGIRFAELGADLLDDICDKHTKNHKVGNILRIYIESLLKDICVALDVRLPFRIGPENDARMTGEMFSALTSTLNKHRCDIKEKQDYKDLELSNFVTTISSHHNPDADSLGDIGETIEKVKKFKNLFVCSKGRMVNRMTKIPGKHKIACECGCLQLEWKEEV